MQIIGGICLVLGLVVFPTLLNRMKWSSIIIGIISGTAISLGVYFISSEGTDAMLCGAVIFSFGIWVCVAQYRRNEKFNPKPPENKPKDELHNPTKKCPFCAEEIKYEAIVCRYCGRDLPTIKMENGK